VIALLLVELRRGFARRVIRGLFALAVLNFAVAGVIVFIVTDSDAEVAAKQAAADRVVRDCLAGTTYPPGSEFDPFAGPVEERFPDVPAFTAPDVGTAEREQFCADRGREQPGEVRRFAVTSYRDVSEALNGLLTLLALVIGATMIGAEWGAKTLATHLTWEPRRALLYAAKALAALLVAVTFYFFSQALELAALAPAASAHGAGSAPPGFWSDWLGLVVRGAGTIGVMAGVGFAIASVTQSTVFALVFIFLLSIVDGIGILVWHDLYRWSLFRNIGAFQSGRGLEPFDFGSFFVAGRSAGSAGLLIMTYALVLLAGGTAVFRRRDIN